MKRTLKPSEAAEDQGHTPAWVNEPVRKVPHCVRCGREQPGARELYTKCDACVEADLAADEAAIAAHRGIHVEPYTRHQRDRGLIPISDIVTREDQK